MSCVNKPSCLPVTRTSSLKKVHLMTEASPVTEASEREPEGEGYHSRARLDAQLWLQCKHALVNSMVGEIRGMGFVKGTN